METKFPVWYPYYCTWSASIAAEAALLACSVVNMGSTHRIYSAMTVTIRLSRLFILLMLPYLYYTGHEDLDCELLVPLDGGITTEYGTTAVGSKQSDADLLTYMKGYAVSFLTLPVMRCILMTNTDISSAYLAVT
jgi:hypothetical protein